MFSLIFKGGPVMIPIILGSIVGLAIIVERFLVFRTVRTDNFEFVQHVFKLLIENKTKTALEYCEQNKKFPIAHVYKIGIERRYLPVDRLEKVLEQSGNNQVRKLEKYLGFLASIVSIEPLLGFLGTITGLIRAFMTWEKAGANVTVNALASGIYEAMLTTAAGLMVAIPFFLCYNYFISKIKYISSDLNTYCLQLLEILTEIRDGIKKEGTREGAAEGAKK